jgi:hypothetical protein
MHKQSLLPGMRNPLARTGLGRKSEIKCPVPEGTCTFPFTDIRKFKANITVNKKIISFLSDAFYIQ